MLPSLLLALLLAPSPAPLEPPGQAVVVPVAGAEGAPLSLPGPDGAPLPVVRAAPDTEDFTLRVLLGALPRAPSARMHGSMAVTDALTALDEGYAEHFQPWVRERTDNPRLREAALGLASRDYAALWLSNVDRTLRTEGVRRNLFVHAQSLPARALDARPDRHALWQEAGTTPTFLADTLRSGQQMVASEGVVATVLHRLVHAPGLGGRFRAPAFYRPFLAPGEEVPVPERRFTPEENGQLKLLAALHALGGRPLDAERPLLVELVEAWGQLFPEEREEAVSLLVHTTFGATVSAEAGRVFRAQARAGLAGDMGAFVEGLPGARALLAGQVREVLEGRASLGGALGPALWLEARDVRVAEAPWAPARTRALRLELNTATAAELMALPGVELALAQRVVAAREARGTFRSVEELRGVPGATCRPAAAWACRTTWGYSSCVWGRDRPRFSSRSRAR